MNKMNDFEIEANLLQIIVSNPSLAGVLDVKLYYFTDKNCEKYYDLIVALVADGRKIVKGDIYLLMRDEGFDPVLIEASWKKNLDESMALEYLKIIKEKYVEREMKKASEDLKPHESIKRAKELEVELEEKEIRSVGEMFDDYRINWEERRERLEKTGALGVITGFQFIDEEIVLEKGNIIVVAALPSVGKTTFSLNIGVNASNYNQNVLYFSIEMSEKEMMDKLFSQVTGLSHKGFKESKEGLVDIGIKDSQDLKDNLKLLNLPRATSTDICMLSKKESLKRPVDIIIVDYIQYLRDPIERGMTKAGVIGDMMKNFKALAAETDSVVIVNAQFNRTAAQDMSVIPKLHQLRESGDIEQDADIVLILHRTSRKAKTAVVKVAKFRNGEAEKEYPLDFYKEKSTFKQKPCHTQQSF